MNTQNDTKRAMRLNLAKQAARLRRIRLTTAPAVTEETGVTQPDATTDAIEGVESRFAWLARTRTLLARVRTWLPRRRKSSKDRLQDWDTWSKFRLWRHTRPLAGSILMFLGSLFLLALPIYFLSFAFLLNSLWASMLLGGLLLVMALIPLFLPSYAVITGSIGIVISLVSFITSSFGGFGFGMLLGIIGSTLSIAWRPVKRSRLVAARSASTSK
ncbi:MAG TPA: DUF6114 domain-containing protein [Ktedonobacteraceae bacterium]